MAEGTQTPPAPLAMKDLITEAGLADRGWAKDYLDKPLDKDTTISFLKKLDGAETLLGKPKLLLPADDAKDDEIEAFLGKLRPAKPDDYEIKLGEKPDENFVKAFRESAHFAGLNKVQTKRLVEKLTPHFQAAAKAQLEENAKAKAEADKRDSEFADLLKNMTGPEFDKKSTRVQAAVKELVPEAARKFVDKIDDKSLALFVAFADALLVKYAKEDDFNGNSGGGGGAAQDKNTLVEELKNLYAEPARNDFRHADHEKINKRINEILAHPALSK
jgi:hypothetical protein